MWRWRRREDATRNVPGATIVTARPLTLLPIRGTLNLKKEGMRAGEREREREREREEVEKATEHQKTF
jgi:hypothetical protein